MDRISRKETSFICSVIKEGMLNAWNCEMNKSTRKRTRASSSNTRAFLKCWVRVCARVPVCVCVQDTYRWNTILKLRSSPGVLHPWTGITGFTWKANDQMSMICMRERALTHTHTYTCLPLQVFCSLREKAANSLITERKKRKLAVMKRVAQKHPENKTYWLCGGSHSTWY